MRLHRVLLHALTAVVVLTIGVATATAATHVVTMAVGSSPVDFPRSLIINFGDTVTWQNPANSGLTHDIVGADGFFPPESGAIPPGGSFSFTYSSAGTYRYYCLQHGAANGGGESGIIYVGNRRFMLPDEHTLALNAWDFDPSIPSSTPGESPNDFRTGNANFIAGVHLPAGTQITGIEIYGCDSDPTQTISGDLQRCQDDTPAIGPSPCLPVFQISQPPAFTGCGFIFNTSTPAYPELVDNLGRSYVARVVLNSSSLRFRTFRIFYRSSIGFPPANATFTDVPSTHPFFRFIEELYAAGITAGCSASPPQYCPDAPLTRGQMAVFLSKALGLNWPY